MDSNKFGLGKDEKEMESRSDMEDNHAAENSKSKRKRRSKNEQEGRQFRCPQCGKSYLSQPALTNHNKTKHHQNDPDYIKRGRGRPRKNPVYNNSSQTDKDIQKFKFFFNKDNRRKTEVDTHSVDEITKLAFNDLRATFQAKLFKKHANPEQHPFLLEINKAQEEVKSTCDQIFASYIQEFFSQTSRDYFIFLMKFVFLFRECINTFRHSSDELSDFTQENSADSVPDLCNEFITDFMENNDNFGLDTTEMIELIQHFCQWLYENKFTTSRLTLLS